MNKTNRLFVVGMTAALLSIPAFAAKLNLTDCPNKVTPAYQEACKKDNAMRDQCNATKDPLKCYNNGKGPATAAPVTTAPTAPQQTAQPSPCQTEFNAWQNLAKNPTPNTTKDAQQKKFAWEACLARSK